MGEINPHKLWVGAKVPFGIPAQTPLLALLGMPV
jgi:hypothetical protein